LEKAEIA